MFIAFDLDDTLYKERDYLLSAFRRIARIIGERHPSQDPVRLYNRMRRASDPFGSLQAALPSDWPESDISWMVHVYRTHLPDIRLPADARGTLDTLSRRGHTLALITDGRSVTQRHKIEALGLSRWIDDALVSVSEEIGADKRERAPFERMERLTPGHDIRVYVADNPDKDFRWPKALGWRTVCLRDNGRNIHGGHPGDCDPEYRPDSVIDTLAELLDRL